MQELADEFTKLYFSKSAFTTWRDVPGYLVDCYRFYPDGMQVLLEDAGFKVIECGVDPIEAITETYSAFPVADCYGVGRKLTKEEAHV